MKTPLICAAIILVSGAATAQQGAGHSLMRDFGDGAAASMSAPANGNAFDAGRQWNTIRDTDIHNPLIERDILNSGIHEQAVPMVRQFGDEDSTCMTTHTATVCN